MSDLSKKHCVPCEGGTPRLGEKGINDLLSKLNREWKVEAAHHLKREFSFKDFRTALDFTNAIGAIAEQENHHPNIYLTWGKVRVEIWTHKIDGLTESDFILASKIDEIPKA